MNWTWIVNGGFAKPVTMEAPPTLTRPHNTSDGKYEVRMSNHKEPPSLRPAVSKVRLSDEVEHVLNKGAWAVTLAMHQGWKILIKVSYL